MSSGDPETRKRILEETWQLLEQKRGKDVRLEDIARAAGVSRQAVYLHFGSRKGLLVETARYVDETLGMAERTQPIRDTQYGIEAIEQIVKFWANYVPDIYGIAKALLAVRDTDEAAAAAWDDRMNVFYQGTLNTVGCLQRDKMLAPHWTMASAADFIWATLSFEVWEHLTIERGWTTEQYIERMTLALKGALIHTA